MLDHPISDLFKISMNSIKEMMDVNTVIGETYKVNDEISVIPISKVKCTFLTGGLDQKLDEIKDNKYPFGGATGGSVNLTPIAFLIGEKNSTKILHVEDSAYLWEKIIDVTPDMIDKLKQMFNFKGKASEE